MRSQAAIGGTLLPAEYIADRLLTEAKVSVPGLERTERRLHSWWRAVEQACGPASGLRALADQIAMPLFGALGYSARDLHLGRTSGSGLLETAGGTAVPFLLLHWSDRPASLWRDAANLARQVGARWCFVLAPPYLSVVDARGWAIRRSVDVSLPHVLTGQPFQQFYTLVSAAAFERSPAQPTHFERIVTQAAIFQDRVRSDLQIGVMTARRLLGGAIGLVSSRTDGHARRPASASLDDQALTVAYRILFLLFAESRGLAVRGSPEITGGYSMSRLCAEAMTADEARYSLWEGLVAITRMSRVGASLDTLDATPFDSRLFARVSAPAVERRSPARRATPRSTARERLLREALAALGSRAGRAGRQAIQYADLGVEELGAVYERLLDDLPGAPREAPPRRHHSVARKRTGTFYTPQPLADLVVRRTLAPLVEQATSDQILNLRIVDPAMGSGAFLVAVCRYLEVAYGRALIEEGRLSVDDLDEERRAGFRRLIAERCLAGVDNNPVAVQLARLSLWLTTLAAGRPLSFLDHRLRVGNSLIGAEPAVLANMGARHEVRGRARPLFELETIGEVLHRGGQPLQLLLELPADTLKDVRTKEALWRKMTSDRSALAPWRRALSLWCAHWFWPPGAPPPSDAERRALLDAILHGARTLGPDHLKVRLDTVAEAAGTHRFFHWPLEFPDVFGDDAGHPATRAFDVVIGNPPWEMLRRDPDDRRDDGRRRLVRFIRESGRYPSCDRGHVNLYQPFVDRALALVRPGGRVGLVLPWGLAVDDGASRLRRRLLDATAIDTIVGFDNAKRLFPIHRGLRFLVMVATAGRATDRVRLRFGLKTREELADLADHDDPLDATGSAVTLTRSQLAAIGGPLRRLPDLRRPHELEFLEGLAARFPAFGASESWRAEFGRELNATDVKPHLTPSGLPILEGKHIHRYRVVGRSSSRIERSLALRILPDARFERPRLGYRDVSGVANSRSVIATVIPAGVLTTHTIFCLRTVVTDEQRHFLCGLLNSFVINAVARLLMGNHLTTSLVESFPIPPWNGRPRQRAIARLAARLSLRPADHAADAALEAHVAHLYGIGEQAFAALLSGFPLVPAASRTLALARLNRLSRRRAK